MSVRNIRRWGSRNGINKHTAIQDEEAVQSVAGAVANIGRQAGPRYVKGYLEATAEARVGENMIAKILKTLSPDGPQARLRDFNRNLIPVPYSAEYFGHRLHMDQNLKLVGFGVTHVLAIYGYSGYVVGHITMPTKDNITIYEHLLRQILLTFGTRDQIVVDQGREFFLSLAVHQSLAEHRQNTGRVAFCQVPSKNDSPVFFSFHPLCLGQPI